MTDWTPDIDPSTIPDDVLASERGRRNAARRKTRSGGVIWRQHNPSTRRCRCRKCTNARMSLKTQRRKS